MRHRKAPQILCVAALPEPRQLLVAAGEPVGCGLGSVLPLATQGFAGSFDRRLRATQPQAKRAHTGIFHPIARVEWQWPAAPSIEPVQRLRLAAFKTQRGLHRSHRQHLEADLGDQAQRAHGAHHQARHVITRDVLHDLAAKGQQFTTAVDELQAQHVVAHSASRSARRTAQAAGNHAAYGRYACKMRRLKRQALTLCRQQRLEFGQPRTRAHSDHQLARLVTGHTGKRCGVKQFTLQGLPIKILAAAAANAQRCVPGCSGTHPLRQGACDINICKHGDDGKRLRDLPF